MITYNHSFTNVENLEEFPDIRKEHEKFYDDNIEGYLEFKKMNSNTIYNNLDLYYFVLPRILTLKGDINILDAGCGIGTDLLYFTYLLEKRAQGFDISGRSVDHCRKMGLNVKQDSFETFDTNEKFDLIWAYASFQHIYPEQTYDIFRKYEKFLNRGGYIFCNFMLHDDKGEEGLYLSDGRYYLCIGEKIGKEISLLSKGLYLDELLYSQGLPKKEGGFLYWINLLYRKE